MRGRVGLVVLAVVQAAALSAKPDEAGRPSTLAPEKVAETDARGDRVLWTGSAPKGLSNIFWSHIPKTSTTWARTIFSYACGADADFFSEVSTTRTISPSHGACTSRLSREQDELVNGTDGYSNVTWFHMSVPWSTGEQAAPLVRGVTLLRKPAARLHSEYRMLTSAEGFICCGHVDREERSLLTLIPGQDWGWDRVTRGAAVSVAHGRYHMLDSPNFVDTRDRAADPSLATNQSRLSAFRRVLIERNALYGCQTKMILGVGCHESHALTPSEMQRARQYVSSGELAFVGLSERYQESVCLFHVMHGGPLWDFEAHLPAHEPSSYMDADAVARAVMPNPEDEAPRTSFAATVRDAVTLSASGTTEADFEGGSDDPDNEIYALAVRRFDASIAEHRYEMESCLRALA